MLAPTSAARSRVASTARAWPVAIAPPERQASSSTSTRPYWASPSSSWRSVGRRQRGGGEGHRIADLDVIRQQVELAVEERPVAGEVDHGQVTPGSPWAMASRMVASPRRMPARVASWLRQAIAAHLGVEAVLRVEQRRRHVVWHRPRRS